MKLTASFQQMKLFLLTENMNLQTYTPLTNHVHILSSLLCKGNLDGTFCQMLVFPFVIVCRTAVDISCGVVVFLVNNIAFLILIIRGRCICGSCCAWARKRTNAAQTCRRSSRRICAVQQDIDVLQSVQDFADWSPQETQRRSASATAVSSTACLGLLLGKLTAC